MQSTKFQLAMGTKSRATTISTVFLLLTMVAVCGIRPAQAQTFTVLHSFTGGADGAVPIGSGLTLDRAGNLYGGAVFGGLQGAACYQGQTCGSIFKLSRRGSGWILSTLYSFHGPEGASPDAPVVFAPDGTIYSTTYYGGTTGAGVVFRLQPPPTSCSSTNCPWRETVLHSFAGTDGSGPAFGGLIFDAAGNIYGTATSGAAHGYGNVFELSRNGNQWTISSLWDFTSYLDGASSWSGVTIDHAGVLYGTTTEGGAQQGGTAFSLTPSGQSWTMTPLHQFDFATEGSGSFGNVLLDASGNVFGTNRSYGVNGGGGVFELNAFTGWSASILQAFNGPNGPQAPLLRDAAGNLYGTSVDGGTYGAGEIFKLTPNGSGYTYTDLYDFTGGTNGEHPYGQIVMDADGNLYGTTEDGGVIGGDICGNFGCGIAWELTP